MPLRDSVSPSVLLSCIRASRLVHSLMCSQMHDRSETGLEWIKQISVASSVIYWQSDSEVRR